MNETVVMLIALIVMNVTTLIMKITKRVNTLNSCCCKISCSDPENPPNTRGDSNETSNRIQNQIAETLLSKFLRGLTPRRNNETMTNGPVSTRQMNLEP